MAKSPAVESRLPRRAILGGLIGLPMAIAAPVQARSADHDLITAIDTAMGMSDEVGRMVGPSTEWWTDEDLCAFCDRQNALIEMACATPATTPEGLAAKARMVLDRHRGDGNAWNDELCMLTSLCRDLIGDPNA